MSERRALLIGVEDYGDGLIDLHSARNDLSLMREALEFCGYKVDEFLQLPHGGAEGGEEAAAELSERIADFCTECGDDDTHVIYFTGHGTSASGEDFLIPAGVGRDQAEQSENRRIPTDLRVHAAAGLVVFIIDACRDEFTTKGGSFGDHPVGGKSFVRFLGCKSTQKCQVLPKGHNGEDVSLFTKALADALIAGNTDSIEDLVDQSTQRGKDLAGGILKVQEPHLDWGGETSAETLKAQKRRIFNPPVRSTLWERFDRNLLHCLVLVSENETRRRPEWTLEGLVEEALTGKIGWGVWNSFRDYADGRVLLDQLRRDVPIELQPARLATFAVKDAFNDEVFDDIVRGLVEADLVVFDVTDFEPGMMLLMGIRAASRRGLSICTHGGGWHELDEIDTPFNLRDLSIGSHTEPASDKGKDQAAKDFASRIEFGFEQMARRPRYQDLPAYEALRQLPPHYEAALTIPAKERVLVLASYGKNYRDTWRWVRNTLEGCLVTKMPDTKVMRLIDDGNPQLVSQALYEQIRRTAGCVVDWTEYSPSTFFELGVRLAASTWGALQLIDERYLPGEERAEEWSGATKQIARMRDLFQPLTYLPKKNKEALETVAGMLAKWNPELDQRATDPPVERVHQIVSDALKYVEQVHVPIYEVLRELADGLHHDEQSTRGAPMTLFVHSSDKRKMWLKRESEEAAREARIAAWLYLHYRMEAGNEDPDSPIRKLHKKLGEESATALYSADEIDLAMLIESDTQGNGGEE